MDGVDDEEVSTEYALTRIPTPKGFPAVVPPEGESK